MAQSSSTFDVLDTHARATSIAHAVLAAVVYPALLLTQRGSVAADSKQLLFLDAGRMLARAPFLWDPTIGMGTVTHQNIGYLLPMGPWFWLTEQLGVPVWVSQRLWLGTVLFAAGAGVLFLGRTLRWTGTGPLVAALAYALSPFVLQYATHLSVLLLPFAALPWLVGCALRAVGGGWRWPACFAIAVALSGSVNATAIVCVLVGPAIALVVAAVQQPSARRQALAASARLAVLSLAVSLWWMVALAIESRYALDVLDFTESLETVTLASTAPELLRGLGYWFFYGRDPLDPYLEGAEPYLSSVLLPISFVPVLLAAAAAFVVRWRHRALAVALVVAATVLAVGAHPFDDPSPFGDLFRTVLEDVGPARAMRSITRITPLLVLGLALLLGAGVTALAGRSRRTGRLAAIVAVVAVLASIGTLWVGDLVSGTRVRPEDVPRYWQAAGKHIDAGSHETRVLEIPGIDFAAYDWGYAHDSVTRGLTDRPVVGREVVPYGTEASVDLVDALDRRLQAGTFDVAALVPIARLISARNVLVRNDLQNERYRTVAADAVAAMLASPPPGLEQVATFGDGNPPRLEVFDVTDVRPIVRAESTEAPVVVAGSGDGVVDLAEAGLLPDGRLVVYSATLRNRPRALQRMLADDAALVVTDTNRRRALRAKTIYDNTGYTERAGEEPLRLDREDARLELFPGSGDDARTVTVVNGPRASATSYGNPLTLAARERPMLAVDGDPTTAWRVGEFWTVTGERLQITLPTPVETDQVTLLQAGGGNRRITRVRLSFDGGHGVEVDLGRESLSAPGQVVPLASRRFERLTIQILESDPADRVNNHQLSGVGLAEVSIPGVRPAEELARVPRDLLDLVGGASQEHELTFLLSRLRGGVREAEEARLGRVISLPTTRSFTISGTARLVTDAAGGTTAPGCRSDLLSVDGVAVELIVGGDTGDGARSLTTCTGAPLTLDAGRHVVRAADGRSTGVDIDRVVLASGAGGGPAEPASSPRVGRTPTVRVADRGRTSIDLEVRGADAPFWLVLGESHNDGWHASARGRALGKPLLVDGAFNGWYVDPRGRTSFPITLEWAPQRWVWVGLGISGVALALCVALAFRRRPSWRADDAPPSLVEHLDPPGAASGSATLLVTLGTGLLGAVVVGPVAGVVIGLTALAALRLRHGRSLLAAAALLALGGSFASIVVIEAIERYRADFPWPASFEDVHAVALTGVALLGVDIVVSWARRQRPSERPGVR